MFPWWLQMMFIIIILPVANCIYCLRERKCTIQAAGFACTNAEKYLKPIDEMLRLFSNIPMPFFAHRKLQKLANSH
jgi:hypothetical protein